MSEGQVAILPCGKRVIIEPDEPAKVSKGGILIPDSAQHKDRTAKGTVRAIGPEVKQVKQGDRVVYALYAGSSVEVTGKTYQIVTEDDVLE